jgi:hypothetical protein
MTTQPVTLHLPEEILKRAQQAAQALQRPLEEVLTATLAATLPDVTDAPASMQAELARMTWLSNEELWQLARSQMPTEAQTRLEALSQRQAEATLTPAEDQELDQLRQTYGQITLRKARAYALLSLRGGHPLLADI